MARYTISEVKIDGSYPVQEIWELSMDAAANRHGFLTYGGLISEEAAIRYIQQSADKQTVNVSLRGETEFCGYPHYISVEYQNNHWYLRVVLVTSSVLLDVYMCNRFFQDTTHTYEDIITEAYDDSGTGNIVAIRDKEEIARPILQYRETNWMFTLRMAGRLCTVVIPNIASAEPQVTLGVPNRPAKVETNSITYAVGRNPEEYKHKFATDERINFHNFLYYKMRSDNRYRLGDSVNVDGKLLTVMQKTFEYTRGEIVEHYILGHEEEFAVPFHHNKKIAGLELEGKVLERRFQELKILLDIDAKRPECGKSWFYYAPDTNNGMYSMPLVDEKVMLNWLSDTDCDTLVLRPCRKNGNGMPHHGERHFMTDCENHLMMMPDKIEYKNPVGSMKWLAHSGFDISTNKKVSIIAGHDVVIASKAQVRGYSPERITASKTGVESSIDMICNEIHIKAKETVNETSAVRQYKKSTLPRRPEKCVISSSAASKLRGAIKSSL